MYRPNRTTRSTVNAVFIREVSLRFCGSRIPNKQLKIDDFHVKFLYRYPKFELCGLWSSSKCRGSSNGMLGRRANRIFDTPSRIFVESPQNGL